MPSAPGRMPARAWSRIRRRLLQSAGWRCGDCGLAGRLEVHHRDGDRRNNDPGNLAVLCGDCHRRAHDTAGPGVRAWRESVRELRGG